MDFLDPKKNYRHAVMLYVGYFLIAIAVTLTTIILVYLAYGFGLGKNGKIIQNGLLYLSSQPNPATVYVNGKQVSNRTNTRLVLPENIYKIELTEQGYRTWSRSIEIDGGTVVRYDYPFLIPNKLSSTSLKSYSSAPGLVTQSLDRRWVVVEQPGSISNFELYDLNAPTKQPTTISVPSGVLTKATSSESISLVAWSNDNQHVLLLHNYDSKSEYIMLDIADPTQSFNLSQKLNGVDYTAVSLNNEKYDQYYLYDSGTKVLTKDSLGSPTQVTPVLSNVLSFDTYQSNTVIYATTTAAAAGKVNIDILDGNQNYHIKTFNAGSTYLLDMAGYNGTIYVAAGAASENKVYIYEDPVSQLQATPKQAPVPSQVLFVTNPNYLSFSNNAQFIVAEGGQQFGVYDIQNGHGYNYTSTLPLDSPQVHATWMDGDRLTYISNSKVVIFDYDHNYQQTLAASAPQYLPFFDPNYKFMYNLAQDKSNFSFNQTSLLAKP
ncbi:MAG TPA: PEGA domain-containing protein [Candidatus Saccharimonadales bacterium]